MPSRRPYSTASSTRIRAFLCALLAIAAASGALILSANAASAAQAYATTNVNMRAGPATDYPVVTTLAAGEVVAIYGCLADRSWCDVSTPGNRGWVSNDYLSAARGSRVGLASLALPAVAFSYAYWDSYYAQRPWYNTWWGHGRPRPPYYHRPGYHPPGYRPPPPGTRPPGGRPPGIYPPPGGRPPHHRPPHHRPPHGTKPGVRPGHPPHQRPSRAPGHKRPVVAPHRARGQ